MTSFDEIRAQRPTTPGHDERVKAVKLKMDGYGNRVDHSTDHEVTMIPRVTRYSLADEVVIPLVTVESTCTVCLECNIFQHAAPKGMIGFCNCGCEWTEEGLILTEEVKAIKSAIAGDDGCGCG